MIFAVAYNAGMAETTRKCWLTFEGGSIQQPVMWTMSRQFPGVVFDIRQASLQSDIGVMSVFFQGEHDEIEEAIEHLKSQGVQVDPVNGG